MVPSCKLSKLIIIKEKCQGFMLHIVLKSLMVSPCIMQKNWLYSCLLTKSLGSEIFLPVHFFCNFTFVTIEEKQSFSLKLSLFLHQIVILLLFVAKQLWAGLWLRAPAAAGQCHHVALCWGDCRDVTARPCLQGGAAINLYLGKK